MAHDGDNAWGGGSSYYQQSVPEFANAAANKGYMPTTVQQFLNSNPVPVNDLVHVEDGSWVNAENDWGHPQFINWLWPLYSKTDYRFNPDGWTEDARNWAVVTATENYVIMAEDLAGSTDISKIINPGTSATNAEKAWHFFLPSLSSCYMYYGKSLDMEVKQTIAGNSAITHAQNEINLHAGVDHTAPSVFIPQRFPYNPGGKGFGPIYSYKEVQNSSDFHVWTFAYDVSGLQSVVLKYRTDVDGLNPLTDNVNEIYAGGNGVSTWNSIEMTRKVFPKTNIANDPEIDFFVLPTAIADLCYAEIIGLSEVLVDYYVEATDSKGNVFKTPIQHVFVGQYSSTDVVTLKVDPASANYEKAVDVTMNATSSASNVSIKIYYTSDGTEPDSTDNLYIGSFKVGTDGKPVTVKAIAYDSKKNVSSVITRNYTFESIESFNVHFKNTSNWSTVNIYLFDKVANAPLAGWTWPGKPMTKEGTSPWYLYTINETVEVGIVFNNGSGQQTSNLFRTTDGWYDNNTKIWYDECPGNCPGNYPVTGVFVSPSSETISIGETKQLAATVEPSNANNKNVSWSSDNSAIATVNSSGLVTGISNGTTIIIVTTEDGAYTDTSTITVNTASTTYYRIKNRWKTTTYLKDANDGKVTYGINPVSTDLTYQWSKETVDGTYFRLKNRATGFYMNNEGLLDYVQSTTIQTIWWSAMWSEENTGDGWKLFRNKYRTTDLIHIENLKGYAQCTGGQNSWWSAMWQLETVTSNKSAKITESIENINPDLNISIYPNPLSSGQNLNVLLPGTSDDEGVIMTFYNITGKEIIQKKLYSSGALKLDLPVGIYIVTIQAKNVSINKRLVVK